MCVSVCVHERESESVDDCEYLSENGRERMCVCWIENVIVWCSVCKCACGC